MARYALGALVLWPLGVLVVAIPTTLVWAWRRGHPWLGAVAAVLIFLVGYAAAGSWIGSYGYGLMDVAKHHGSRCALIVAFRQPALLRNVGFEGSVSVDAASEVCR